MANRLLKDPATASSRIFVGHLQTETLNRAEFEEHFAKYGSVVGSVINRGFAFVQFDDEPAARAAIQSENGAMFKGRRMDVKPAKQDGPGGGMGGGGGGMGDGMNRQGGPKPFGFGNDSFKGGNQNFRGNNQNFGGGNSNMGNDNSFQNTSMRGSDESLNRGDQFNDNNMGGRDNNDQFNNDRQGNQNRGGNDSFGGGNQNRGGNQFGGGGPNRPGGMLNQGMGGGGGGGGGGGRKRGSRGGKNRKNMDNSGGPGGPGNQGGPGGPGFRDRSPINRNNRMDDMGGRDWDMGKPNMGGRGGPGFGRDSFNDGNRYDDYKPQFGPSVPPSDYPPAQMEKNDCEIIVVNKSLTEYAEVIESRLKKIGLTVDLLFPNEEVPLSRVLGNIASRGCLYAVVIMPVNQEHRSLTLNILHGLPQEHRNMPVEDAINLIARDFANCKAGNRSVPLNIPSNNDRHPDAVQVLLNMLADNLQLTVLQYDRIIKYLEIKREEQVQIEIGDSKDLHNTSTLSVSDPKQAELQSRILNILNSNKTNTTGPAPSPVPAPTPAPVPSTTWGSASTTAVSSTTTTTTSGVTPSPLLNDPTVQKALDSLLQGNLLKSIGEPQSPATTSAPLFAAFPNIGRF
ncbi:nuclear receptor coactivator 5 isoform X2 [Leptopilina boulardi]|uniref:nuclear receptor coactivator 5 isoform X2 n=1 Tax=Leptopilina boulardi TaxID=63433 RepID=UPI0021F5BC0E|nr:nuclear receptor coactivator 5 isoform X2 [Leptopilina boulardi]